MASGAPLTNPVFNGYAYGSIMGYGPPNSNGPIAPGTLPMTGAMAPLKDVVAATGLDPQLPEFGKYRELTAPINVYDVFNDRIIPFATTDLTVALAQNPTSFITSVLASTVLLPGPGYKINVTAEQNFLLPWEPAAPYTPTTAMTSRVLSYQSGMTTIQRSVVADLRTMLDPVRGPAVNNKNHLLLAYTSRLTMDRYVLAKAFDYGFQNRVGVGPDKIFLKDHGQAPVNPAFHLIEEIRFGIGNLETPNVILAHIAEHARHLPPGRKIFVLPPGARTRLAGTIQYEKVESWKAYTSILTPNNEIERSGEIIITEATEAFRPSGFGSDVWVEPRDLRFQPSEPPFDPSLVQRRFGQFYILQTADRLARINGGPFESGTPVAIYDAQRDKLVNLTAVDTVHFSGVFNQASTARDAATGDKAYSSKFRQYVASDEATQQAWVRHIGSVRRQAVGADRKRRYQFDITTDNPNEVITRGHVFACFDERKKKVVPCKYIGDMEPCNFTDAWSEVAGNSVQAVVDKRLSMGLNGGASVLAGMLSLLADLDSLKVTQQYINAIRDANQGLFYSNGTDINPDVIDGSIWERGATLSPPGDADSMSWGAGFGTYAGISALARTNVNMTTTTVSGRAAAVKAQFDSLADILTSLFPGNPLLESGNKAWDGKDAAASLLNNLVNHRPFAWLLVPGTLGGQLSRDAQVDAAEDAALVADSVKRIYDSRSLELPNFDRIRAGIAGLNAASSHRDIVAAFLGAEPATLDVLYVSGSTMIEDIWVAIKNIKALARLEGHSKVDAALRELVPAYLVTRTPEGTNPTEWFAKNAAAVSPQFKALPDVARIVNFYFAGPEEVREYIATLRGTASRPEVSRGQDGNYYVRVPLVVSATMFRDIYAGKLAGILASDPRFNYRRPLRGEDVAAAYPTGIDAHPDYKRIGMLTTPESAIEQLIAAVRLPEARRGNVSAVSEDDSGSSSGEESRVPSGGNVNMSGTDDNSPFDPSRAVGDVRRLFGAPRVQRDLAGTQVGDTSTVTESKLFNRISRLHNNWKPKIDGIVARHNNRVTPNAVYELLYTFQPITAQTIERFYNENVLIPADSLYIRPSIVLHTQGILISNEYAHWLGVTAPYVKTVSGMESGYIRMDAVQERMMAQTKVGGSTIVPDVFIKDYRGGLNTVFFDLGMQDEYVRDWLDACVDPAPVKDILPSLLSAFVPLTENLSTNVLYTSEHRPTDPKAIMEKTMVDRQVLEFYKNAKGHSSVGFITHATKTVYAEDYASRIAAGISWLENPANIEHDIVNQVPFLLYRGPLSDPSRNQRFDGVGPLGACRTQSEGAAHVLAGLRHQFPVLNNDGRLTKLS